MQNHLEKRKLFLLATKGIFEIQGISVTVYLQYTLSVHVLWLQCDIFVISNEFTEYIANFRTQGVCMHFSKIHF